MNRQMTQLLNLPEVIVENLKETQETLILKVKNLKETAGCPRCSQSSYRLHQNQRYLVRDLPIGNREVFLWVNRRRFKCENCQKPYPYELREKLNCLTD
jgi:transposase